MGAFQRQKRSQFHSIILPEPVCQTLCRRMCNTMYYSYLYVKLNINLGQSNTLCPPVDYIMRRQHFNEIKSVNARADCLSRRQPTWSRMLDTWQIVTILLQDTSTISKSAFPSIERQKIRPIADLRLPRRVWFIEFSTAAMHFPLFLCTTNCRKRICR